MFNLSWVQRLTLFVMCFSAGAMMIGLSFMFLPMILLKPHKFAAAFTAGNLLAIMRYDLLFSVLLFLSLVMEYRLLHALLMLLPVNVLFFLVLTGPAVFLSLFVASFVICASFGCFTRPLLLLYGFLFPSDCAHAGHSPSGRWCLLLH